MKTIVSEKGQITIPKAARAKLGLEPGVVLEITCENGRLVASKRSDENPYERWRGKGCKTMGRSTDAYLKRVRG
jgi:antitoxin PrlF